MDTRAVLKKFITDEHSVIFKDSHNRPVLSMDGVSYDLTSKNDTCNMQNIVQMLESLTFINDLGRINQKLEKAYSDTLDAIVEYLYSEHRLQVHRTVAVDKRVVDDVTGLHKVVEDYERLKLRLPTREVRYIYELLDQIKDLTLPNDNADDERSKVLEGVYHLADSALQMLIEEGD